MDDLFLDDADVNVPEDGDLAEPVAMADDDGDVATKRQRLSEPPPAEDGALGPEFSNYARPSVTVLPDSLELMIVDVEAVTGKIREDMDAPDAERAATEDVPQGQTGHKRRHDYVFKDKARGPIMKLYGVTDDERSVCLDVYGYYPSFLLQIVKGTPSMDSLKRVKNYIEKFLAGPTGAGPMKLTDVVAAAIVTGFSAFPYKPEPSIFYSFKLARPRCVRLLAEHFVKTPEFDDAYSDGGVLGVVPHCGEDGLTQYVVNSDISGFGWVRAQEVADSFDSWRVEAECCTCSYIGDCRAKSVAPLHGRENIAPIRIMGIDIECLKEDGMPSPLRHSIIIIGVVICKAVNGVIDPESRVNIIFTWYPPGSGGVAPIPAVHHVSFFFFFNKNFFLHLAQKKQTVAVNNETAMMRAFGSFLRIFDPDIIIGHNIVGFDIPYIVTRANAIGVEEAMYLGRRKDMKWTAPREITRVRKNGDTRTALRAETHGRIQLDTLPFMQSRTKESSYRLGALSQKYLEEGKDDLGYQMIKPLWLQSPATRSRLCAYCLKDVQLSLGLAMYKEFEMVLSVIELSRCTRVRASQLLRSGNQEKVKTLVLHAAKTPQFEANNLPVFFPFEVPKSRDKDEKFQGATVINPKRGVRRKNEPVAVGDFSSLYPSIMISNNVRIFF